MTSAWIFLSTWQIILVYNGKLKYAETDIAHLRVECLLTFIKASNSFQISFIICMRSSFGFEWKSYQLEFMSTSVSGNHIKTLKQVPGIDSKTTTTKTD